ncbi:fungal-specific transcription factor domain-containing protein [Hyaloscypha finlandica]|nr:fungal-specific transcription factor domain-containing protein [Hyaloscypha finlandica]
MSERPIDLLPGSLSPHKSRPYRSHRFPACDFCRRRKSRCTRDVDNRPCLLCRVNGVECTRNGAGSTATDESVPVVHRRKRPRESRPELPLEDSHSRSAARVQDASLMNIHFSNAQSQSQLEGHSPEEIIRPRMKTPTPRSVPTPQQAQNQNQTGHIVGPAVARDVQVLEQFMSPTYGGLAVSYARPNPYSVYSDDPKHPIVYLKVPRQRVASSWGNGSAGFKQYETIEKILEPLGNDLFSLYFDIFHPSFPILDEKTVVEAYRHGSLPHSLVCEIYACSLISWNTSTKIELTSRPRPDIRYIWEQTVSALNDEFTGPGFSTVLACILDLSGRPTTSMTYNAVNIGRVVALSKSLGLNQDPRKWSLDQRQKDLRVRAWWGVLIHDWWASLSHGTSPNIHPTQFDVEIPEIDLIVTGAGKTNSRQQASDPRTAGALCFIALCQLTEILGDILPLIYNTKRGKHHDPRKSLLRSEASLEEWEENLPNWLDPKSLDFQRELPGVLSLQLSALAVKICICRVSLLEASKSDERDDTEMRQFYQSRCRRAARAVIEFVTSLQQRDLDAFWLPYTAYHFASAATLILRCALEAANDDIARECVASAQLLISHLRKFKDESNWDLSGVCLSQCEEVVRRMSEGTVLDFRRGHAHSLGSASAPRGAPFGSNSQDSAYMSSPNRFQNLESHSRPRAEFSRNISQDVAAAECLAGFAGQGNAALLGGNDMGMESQEPGNDFLLVPDLWQMDGFDEYSHTVL